MMMIMSRMHSESLCEQASMYFVCIHADEAMNQASGMRGHYQTQRSSRSKRAILLALVLFVALWTILHESTFLQRFTSFWTTINSIHTAVPLPRLALLMTFPNSGTTYTLALISKVTQLATATNYVGDVSPRDNNNATPHVVYPQYPLDGPFWKGPLPLPDTNVLVKTHCTGYNLNNGVFAYNITPERFAGACRYTLTPTEAHHGRYPVELVAKLVHIVRNPFDNFISRFHHEYQSKGPAIRKGKEGAYNWTVDHPLNGTGFSRFCHDLDSDFSIQYHPNDYPKDVYQQIQQTKCHDEVIQYISWHNGAFATSEILKVPSMVFHYEDYDPATFHPTLDRLLYFLELARREEPLPFHRQDYKHQEYYSDQARANIQKLAKMLASEATWNAIQRYFD